MAPSPGSAPTWCRSCAAPSDADARGPPRERLYGRRRGHALRPRQRRLLDLALPRFTLTDPDAPLAAFGGAITALSLEVGYGGGEHALAQVEAQPDVGLIAAEVFENGICSLLSRLVPDGAEHSAPPPANLRLWSQDARPLLARLPPESLERLFLMFPDPWPKSRHTRRRFVQPAILPVVARALRPGGEWRIATDDPTYQAWVTEVLSDSALFTLDRPALARPAGWPGTRYETKAVRAGRRPMWWSVRRR